MKPIDFGKEEDLHRTYLIHGNYGTGKTHFLADALAYEQQNGPVRFYNIAGEDGYLTARDSGLPAGCAFTIESVADFEAALRDCSESGLRAVGIDGLYYLGRMILKSVVPSGIPSVGKGSDDWQRIHEKFDLLLPRIRWMAQHTIITCASDRSMDQVAGELMLTPDLPGRQAYSAGGRFDYVFIMALKYATGNVSRVLRTMPTANSIIRYRLPRSLPPEIQLPEGPGGWAKLQAAIAATYNRGGK